MFVFSLASIIWKAYCIHAAISLSKISILLLHIFLYYCRMFQSINSQPCQGTQEALHIQAPTHAFRKTIFTQNMYSKDSILTYCCPSSTTYLKELCTAVSEHDFAFMSNTCCTPLCKGTAQNCITSRKDLVLCQTCNILEKYCMRHILEGLKRNVRGHAETCLLIIFSSRGCVVFSPIFLSIITFWEGAQTMRTSKKHAHLDDIQRCG